LVCFDIVCENRNILAHSFPLDSSFQAEPVLIKRKKHHANAIAALIDQLKGREQLFAEMAKTIRPASVSIYGGYYVSDEQQGVWFDPHQMSVLAACGIGWGLDLFEAGMLS